MSQNCYYLLVVWVLIIWLLEINFPHGEGDVRVDVGVRVLAGMLLCHRLDLLQDGLLNFRGVGNTLIIA